VLPIPFRFVIEAARTIVGHLIAPEQVTSPGAVTLARRRRSTHQRDLLNNPVYSSRLALARTPLLVADLVHGDAGIAARLSLCAMGSFRFGGWPAKAGTQELLAGVAGHAARLRVAVLHPLLLRVELGARWHRNRGTYSEGD
jgi:hypothetical protein